MIKNESQYRITKAEAERFQQALSELDNRPAGANGVHPLLQKAERDAMASQLEDLVQIPK